MRDGGKDKERDEEGRKKCLRPSLLTLLMRHEERRTDEVSVGTVQCPSGWGRGVDVWMCGRGRGVDSHSPSRTLRSHVTDLETPTNHSGASFTVYMNRTKEQQFNVWSWTDLRSVKSWTDKTESKGPQRCFLVEVELLPHLCSVFSELIYMYRNECSPLTGLHVHSQIRQFTETVQLLLHGTSHRGCQ